MDRWIIRQTVDLVTGEVAFVGGFKPHAIKGDNASIEWVVELMSNGEPANVSGSTCMVYGNRPDKTSAIATATITDNVVTSKLTQQFFALIGKLNCLMVLTNSADGTTITVSELTLEVGQGVFDVIIDPGEALPDISQGLAAISQLSDHILSSAKVDGVVSCTLTGTDTYKVVYSDGTTYTLVANGSNVTLA